MDVFQNAYEKIYFPLFEGCLKGRATAKLYFESLQTQWLSRDQIQEKQLASLQFLLRHAGRHCPYYQAIFRETGFDAADFESLEDLRGIPVLTKDKIRGNFHGLVSATHQDRLWKKSTGGSTGQPLHFAYTAESYAWRTAMSKRGYGWAGAPPGSKQAYIWGTALGDVARLKQIKERFHHFLERQLYANCFNFDEKAMSRFLSRLNSYRPDCIIGYANPLYNFALYVADHGRVSFTPKGIITAAEKVHPHQRAALERVFGTRVFDTYGSREFMLIAAECERHEGLHVSAENLIVEIIKEDGTLAQEGEIGKIVVTDLHNLGMPFIRYEIGDLAVATDKKCSCGRGLPMIAEVTGRTLDMIRTPEGKMVPGEFFPHLIKDFPEIYRFQVVQESLDSLVVKLVPVSEISEATRRSIDTEVRKIMGPAIDIRYETVSDIPLNATGKHRVTVSNIRS
jgi:phenylacetate-CoA ligase